MEQKLRYKLLAGTHRLRDGTKFVRGEIFCTYPHEMEDMKHRVELMDEPPKMADEDKREEIKFKKVHKGAGRWIVINEATNELVHDGTMKKAEADEMVQKMMVGNPEEVKESEEDEEWDEENN